MVFSAIHTTTPGHEHMSSWFTAGLTLWQVYASELESQPQFEGFQDFLRILPLCRGKRGQDSDLEDENEDEHGDDQEDWNSAGKVMARLKVVRR